MVKLKRFEFLVQADTPLAHHEETYGNTAAHMRADVRQPDGRLVGVPIITGDTLRHGLREATSWLMLSLIGMEDGLSEETLQLLFSGGMVRGSAGATVDLAEYDRMSDLMPHIRLLGGCANNRMIPGRIQVDAGLLVCRETRHMLPKWVSGELEDTELQSARSHIKRVQRVRMDPTLDPGKREMLTSGDREMVQGRLLDSAKASEAEDSAGKTDAKSSMMPRRFEVVCLGSLFFARITARVSSDLDTDTLLTMMGAFYCDAQVGGKRGTGHGRLSLYAARHVQVAIPEQQAESFSLVGSDSRAGKLYVKHVQERAEDIRKFLREVDA